MPNDDISWAMRRYAAEIYRLEDETEHVSVSEIAEHAGVSAQAASRMVRRLRDAGLVEHERYRGVQLTETGRRACMPSLRRHRLVEVFLVDVMGFDWAEAHELADRFEDGVDGTIERRMDELTGHPARCPHGEPIPSADGKMPEVDDTPLSKFAALRMPPVSGEISRVRTHDPERLRYLWDEGLRPGCPFEFTSRAPFEGPVTIEKRGHRLVLGRDLADVIHVSPDAADAP